MIGIILARLLAPEDFGLIGMLMVFTALSEKLMVSGFGASLIQKKNLDATDTSTLFFFNIGVSLVLYAILFAAAPFIAQFYDRSILSLILRISAIKIVINACCMIQNMLCSKELDFKVQLIVSMTGLIISGTVGITLALKGFGVWSLVIQTLVNRSVMCIAFWFVHDWRPKWLFSTTRLKEHFQYGAKVTTLGLIEVIAQNIHDVLIGKMYQATALGFYARGKSLMLLFVDNMIKPVNRVVFPAFARLQDEKDALRQLYRKTMLNMYYLLCPVMAGLAVTASPVVEVLLSEKWLPCVPYLRLFCVLGLLIPARNLNSSMFKAMNRVGLAIKVQFCSRVTSVVVLAFTCTISIQAILIGEIIVTLIGVSVLAFTGGRLIDHPLWRQVHDLLPIVALTLVMALGVFFTRKVGIEQVHTRLAVQVLVGIGLYASMSHVFKLAPFQAGCQMIQKRFFRSKQPA